MERRFAVLLICLGMVPVDVVAQDTRTSPPLNATSVNARDSINSQTPFADVRAYGARVDGVTDDTKAICATAYTAAAASSGALFIPNTGHFALLSGSGCSFNRRTRVICQPGAGFVVHSRSGPAFVFGNDASTEWFPGGMDGCILQNTGGGTFATNTSVGLQIGSGTSQGQNMIFERNTIAGFGTGITFAGNGNAFADTFRNNAIFQNLCNGIYFSYTSGSGAEHLLFDENRVFQNGNGGGICTNINVAPGSHAEFWWNGGIIDNGGNHGLGEVYVPANSQLIARFIAVHSENSGGNTVGGPRPFLNCLAAAPKLCDVSIVASDILSNASVPSTYPLFRIRSGKLSLSGGTRLVFGIVGAATTPMVELGDGAHNEPISFSSFGTTFECIDGNLKNCRYAETGAGETKVNYFVAGSMARGSTASPPASFGTNVGTEDLSRTAPSGGNQIGPGSSKPN